MSPTAANMLLTSEPIESARDPISRDAAAGNAELEALGALFRDHYKGIRTAIYTTNVIESLWYGLRRITKTRAAFPSEEAAVKLLWLGLHNA